MDLGDIRRLGGTAVFLGGLTVLWLFFLWLADADQFHWAWPDAALRGASLTAWLWIGAGVLLVILATLALVIFAADNGNGGPSASRTQRQVQCQDCRAVFVLEDNGKRPLIHTCPNCKAIGVYTGTEEPIGSPPKGKARKVVRLDLTCQACHHEFTTTDTGARPLQVQCPSCHATGAIR